MLQTPVYELYTEEAVTSQVRYTVIDNVKYYAVRDIATKLLRYSQATRLVNEFPGIIKAKAYYNNQKVMFNFIEYKDVIKFVTKYRARATPEVMAWAMAVSKSNSQIVEGVKVDQPTINGEVLKEHIFEFGDIKLKAFNVDDQVWFSGRELAEQLGYEKPRNALAKYMKPKNTKVAPNQGGVGATTLISEAGLYKLVIKSPLPQAEAFTDWVTDEVLPSIRKHGAYMTPDTVEQAILNPDTMIQIATRLKEEQEERRRLEEQNQMLSVENERNAVIVETHQKLYDDKRLFTTTQVASHFGFASVGFNRILANLGIQYKPEGSETWILYARYQGKGYTKTETFQRGSKSKMITKWTNKGREFLYKKLKKTGVIDEDWGYKK